MQTELTKVNLLTASSKNDVLVSGGVIKVSGLNDIRLQDLISVDIRNQVDEVVKVATIGTSTPTITASTKYIIKVGNTRKRYEGAQSSFSTYAVTSDASLSGSAATDRSNVYTSLASKINADVTANWTATANVGGSGVSMTITDDAGYYSAGRRGQSSVYLPKNSDGSGFVEATHLTAESTSPVYAFGVGADLYAQAPILDPITGNTIATIQELVKTSFSSAATGQDYNGFYFTSLVTGINGEVYIRHNQLVMVDNGAGAATTNLAGYTAMLREVEKVVYGQYSEDTASMINFFQAGGVAGSILGGAPTGVTGDENIYSNGEATLHSHVLGTQTLLAPIYAAGGLNIAQDLVNNDGMEYSAPIQAGSQKSFVVGEEEFSFAVTFNIADVSGTDDCAVGFRLKADYAANIDDYTDSAVLNVISGNITIETILNNAATTVTDTTNDWADAESHTLEVAVDLDGAVTYKIDNADPIVSAAFSFDAADEVIPYFHFLHAATSPGAITLEKWASIAGIVRR